MKRAAAIRAAAVLDASTALSWLFEDERDEEAIAMANAVVVNGAIVPPLFRWEIQNALLAAVRRKRISLDRATESLAALDELGITVDGFILTSPLATGLGFTQRFGLTAYDAAYLELAVRRSVPLMTRDEKLKRAATDLRLLWKP
ncbi:MAG: type II toxin-antitoxin system VapC family toxin [Vulcanimicrobiaceae bacterium]